MIIGFRVGIPIRGSRLASPAARTAWAIVKQHADHRYLSKVYLPESVNLGASRQCCRPCRERGPRDRPLDGRTRGRSLHTIVSFITTTPSRASHDSPPDPALPSSWHWTSVLHSRRVACAATTSLCSLPGFKLTSTARASQVTTLQPSRLAGVGGA